MASAIIASTLTTCVIFLPVWFMQTTTATLFRELAIVVVFALLSALTIALTLVPMLASRFLSVAPLSVSTLPFHGFGMRSARALSSIV